MEYIGTSNKTSHESVGIGKYSQNQACFEQSHFNNGSRSIENQSANSPEGHKKKFVCDEAGDGSECETTTKKFHHHRLINSVSTSYLSSTNFSATTVSSSFSTTVISDEKYPSIPERITPCFGDHFMDPVSSKNGDWKNFSPTHITISSPTENGDNLTSLRPSLTPSPSPSCRGKLPPASGDSSDERGEKHGKSKLSSREGSFDRSVSFQEGIVEPEKSHETLRASDSNKSLDSSRVLDSSTQSHASSGKDKDRDRKESRESKSGDKDKKNKKAWYSVLNPTYKSRSEELKKLFKDLPPDERLIVDYSCALQKDILVHGRLYVTSNYFSFYSKIFGWETFLSIKCKDIVALTKEKTALVIPNALQVNTETDKHFFTSFTARDKTYLMLFRIWQNALMDQLAISSLSRSRRMCANPKHTQMSASELWQWVHSSYGEELGLTSDDDDYVAPSTTEDDMKIGSLPGLSEVSYDESVNKVLKRESIDSVEDGSQGEQYEEGLAPVVSQGNSLEDVSCSPSRVAIISSPVPLSGVGPTFSLSSLAEKQSQDIPTDFSDTYDSDPDKKLSGPLTEIIVCPDIATHHIGREVANVVYGLPIDTLFTLLFTNSKFMLDLHTARKTYDLNISPWQSNQETNQKIRQVTYTLTLPTSSFGPKVSHVTETQVISSFSKPSEIYTIDAEASNSGIPYADSFYISNHWCLTRESSSETRLVLWSQVKYKKNVWGFMKNVIDKNAFNGLEAFVSDLNAALLLEVDRTNLKRTKRRRRRAGSKGAEGGDPLHVPSPLITSNDIHKSTQIPSRKMTLPSVVMEIDGATTRSYVKSVTVFFLCMLLVLNAFLYYRLYDLEDRVLSNISLKNYAIFDSTIFKTFGSEDESVREEWVKILHHQETLHTEELERWQKAVLEAAEHLKKAEESLRALHASIPSKQAAKMQSLLQQLHMLHQMQDQRSHVSSSSSSGEDTGQQSEEFIREKNEL